MRKLGQAIIYIGSWTIGVGLMIFGFMQMTVY